MASVTLLTADGDTGNSASYVTEIVIPTAGRLYMIGIMNSRGGGVGTVEVSGWELTWEHLNSINEPVTWNSDQRKISLLRATGTPTPGALTITLSVSGSGCLWSVFEIDGAPLTNNGADALLQVEQSSTGSGQSGTTVNMAAFASPDNIALGLFGNLNQEDLIPGDGFTQLSENQIGSPSSTFMVEYKLSADTTIDASAAGTSSWGALGIEIAVESGGTTFPVSVGGALTMVGALDDIPRLIRSGTLTTSGALATIKAILVALTGTLSTAGVLLKQANQILAGTLSMVGALIKQSRRTLTGTLTTSGALGVIRAVLLTLTGALSTAGALARQASLKRGGTLTTSGALTKQITRTISGALTMSSSLRKLTEKVVSSALSLAGAVSMIINPTESPRTVINVSGSFSNVIAVEGTNERVLMVDGSSNRIIAVEGSID